MSLENPDLFNATSLKLARLITQDTVCSFSTIQVQHVPANPSKAEVIKTQSIAEVAEPQLKSNVFLLSSRSCLLYIFTRYYYYYYEKKEIL